MQVSIIIPVYNAAEFVAQAVESALAQPETGQVILVEDGSLDKSLEVCQQLAARDTRVELYQHAGQRNRGVAASRNLGIAAAHCPYTAFLDADDYYLPGRFAEADRLFADHTDIDGVYDAIGTVHEDEGVSRWYRGEQQPELLTINRWVEPEQLFEALIKGHCGFFCTDGIVVRTSLFMSTGGFDCSLRMGEDTAMWLKLAVMGRLVAGCIERPVGMRRLHANNTIYVRRNQNPLYTVQMTTSLLNWGKLHGLSIRRTILLLEWLLDFRMDDASPDVPYVIRKCRELRFFAGFALEWPLVLFGGHFWKLVGGTVGLKRILGYLRQSSRDAELCAVQANPQGHEPLVR